MVSSNIAFTPSVKAAQVRLGSMTASRIEERGGFADRIDEGLAAFVAERDSFYLGTASADGRPYIQHRGGKPGFLRVLDDKRLVFPDYAGNRQYISIGNLAENDRAFIFLMDYPTRRRVKLWGRMEVVDNDAALLEQLHDPSDGRPPDRAFVFHVEAWDVNCPKFITPRFTEEQIATHVAELHDRIARLEVENEALRRQSATAAPPVTTGR